MKFNYIYTSVRRLHTYATTLHVAAKDPTPYKHSSCENNGQWLLDGDDPNTMHRKQYSSLFALVMLAILGYTKLIV